MDYSVEKYSFGRRHPRISSFGTKLLAFTAAVSSFITFFTYIEERKSASAFIPLLFPVAVLLVFLTVKAVISFCDSKRRMEELEEIIAYQNVDLELLKTELTPKKRKLFESVSETIRAIKPMSPDHYRFFLLIAWARIRPKR